MLLLGLGSKCLNGLGWVETPHLAFEVLPFDSVRLSNATYSNQEGRRSRRLRHLWMCSAEVCC